MGATGVVLWQGPSRLDGGPIVALATWGHVVNPKTGPMVQTWILRADQTPGDALRAGEDASICGDCVHRGSQTERRTCYVNVGWGPSKVWNAWRSGAYEPSLTAEVVEQLRGRPLRLGSYGDPAAVPLRAWRKLIRRAGVTTGYTHAWRRPEASGFARYLMASVEGEAQAVEAQAKGWRPFLVLPLSRQIPDGYAWCPSDALNPGTKVPCEDCGACSGTAGGTKPIAIYVHGGAARTYGTTRARERLPLAEARHGSNYDPLVRLGPALHAAVKARAKQDGVPMRRWVEAVCRERLGGTQ